MAPYQIPNPLYGLLGKTLLLPGAGLVAEVLATVVLPLSPVVSLGRFDISSEQSLQWTGAVTRCRLVAPAQMLPKGMMQAREVMIRYSGKMNQVIRLYCKTVKITVGLD